MTFAELVKIEMGKRQIDAKTLSERSGLTPPYISKLLNGKMKEPTWAKACAIIDALEIDIDVFKRTQEENQ